MAEEVTTTVTTVGTGDPVPRLRRQGTDRRLNSSRQMSLGTERPSLEAPCTDFMDHAEVEVEGVLKGVGTHSRHDHPHGETGEPRVTTSVTRDYVRG